MRSLKLMQQQGDPGHLPGGAGSLQRQHPQKQTMPRRKAHLEIHPLAWQVGLPGARRQQLLQQRAAPREESLHTGQQKSHRSRLRLCIG